MFTSDLKRAFELAEKYRMDVSTVTELQKIVMKELNSSLKVEENVLTQILQLLENNKTFLREAQ
ncbi:ABC transporter permease [Solibacillus sp. FSL H8-0538]|uniref:ABC transporter permease n=1 Tax=Solibacillus sp. FSL H8-0538 TaxID=2921400 RepID=UPI0030F5C641